MKYIIKITLVAVLVVSVVSCKKMEHFQENPNKPTVAQPSLELSNIEQDMFSVISRDAGLASRQLVYTQSASNAQYYGWKRSGMDYDKIRQVVKMQQEATRMGNSNYIYLGNFFIDYYIIKMTQAFGDIPYSQIMQSVKDNNFDSAATHPKYDKQADIYLAVLDNLKKTSDSLSTSEVDIDGDIIYNGDILKWKKLINSFSLRVLMSLSKKEGNSDLNIKERFKEIVSNPSEFPLISSNEDNGALQYYDVSGNRYPYYNDNSMKTDFYLDSTFVEMLRDLNDPRLFTYGETTTKADHDGLSKTDFAAYGGLWGSGSLSYNISKNSAGESSPINRRYSYEPVNEPSVLMSYAEVQFLLAEAVVRGWIGGDAETYYENGIRASLEFSNHDEIYSESNIDAYINQADIALKSATAIRQIITQKYISMFMNCGWQAFYEHRRTGYPEFEVEGNGIINQYKGANAVPQRWMYPIDEYNYNKNNVQEAVKRQYPEGDEINSEMWIIK